MTEGDSLFPEAAGNIRAHGLEVWGRVPFGLPTDWSLHHLSLSASCSVPRVELRRASPYWFISKGPKPGTCLLIFFLPLPRWSLWPRK